MASTPRPAQGFELKPMERNYVINMDRGNDGIKMRPPTPNAPPSYMGENERGDGQHRLMNETQARVARAYLNNIIGNYENEQR